MVGADYTNGNGTVTRNVEMEVVVPEVTIPVSDGLENAGSLVEEARNSWKSFTQSRISDKGMNLSFIAPMVVNFVIWPSFVFWESLGSDAMDCKF